MIARLLVEGDTDLKIVEHLAVEQGLDFEIRPGGGYSNLRASLSVQLRASDMDRLGVIVDGDRNAAARWQSLRDAFLVAGYSAVPEEFPRIGLILAERDLPTVGVWIMPDNFSDGMIEDFVAQLIPQSDSLWTRAQQVVDEIPEVDRRFSAAALPKAKIHTWLSWQETPGGNLRSALTRGYVSTQTEPAVSFKGWLSRLFQTASG